METPIVDEKLKQMQFNAAMGLYSSRGVYKGFGYLVAIAIISSQAVLVCLVVPHSIGLFAQLLIFVCAYLCTDFINGLTHMYMDHNDHYDSLAGPLIANFHLHHKIPKYKINPILIVYFVETGSKLWLVVYLAIVMAVLCMFPVNPFLAYFLVYVGILSSIAEVSHYLCHTSNSRLTLIFSKYGLLLSKKHHARHHLEDNVNYAFLNGWSDQLLNQIAKQFYPGYKNTTDRHYANYDTLNAESR